MEKERLLFLRLFSFCYGHALDVVIYFMNTCLLTNGDFVQYLDANKHSLYHKCFSTIPCCECFSGNSLAASNRSSKLTMEDLASVFDISGPSAHVHRPRGVNRKHCLCKISTKPGISIETLQIGKLHKIITECVPPMSPNLKNSLTTIRNTRNYLAHISNEGKLNEVLFEQKWKELESAVLAFAGAINPFYFKLEQKQISTLKNNDVNLNDIQDKLDIVSNEIKNVTNTLKESENNMNILRSTIDEQRINNLFKGKEILDGHELLSDQIENANHSHRLELNRVGVQYNNFITDYHSIVKKASDEQQAHNGEIVKRLEEQQEKIDELKKHQTKAIENQADIRRLIENLDTEFTHGESKIIIYGESTNVENSKDEKTRTVQFTIDVDQSVNKKELQDKVECLKSVVNSWESKFRVKSVEIGSIVIKAEVDSDAFESQKDFKNEIQIFIRKVLDEGDLVYAEGGIVVRVKELGSQMCGMQSSLLPYSSYMTCPVGDYVLSSPLEEGLASTQQYYSDNQPTPRKPRIYAVAKNTSTTLTDTYFIILTNRSYTGKGGMAKINMTSKAGITISKTATKIADKVYEFTLTKSDLPKLADPVSVEIKDSITGCFSKPWTFNTSYISFEDQNKDSTDLEYIQQTSPSSSAYSETMPDSPGSGDSGICGNRKRKLPKEKLHHKIQRFLPNNFSPESNFRHVREFQECDDNYE